MLSDFEDEFGNAGKALSRLIRPTIVAPPGKKLVWGDWSNIEARGLPWLARAEERLDVFRAIDADPGNTPDVYIQAAAGMYHKDAHEMMRLRKAGDKEVKSDRQKGKIAELALGFAGGVGALQNMAAQYGMVFEGGEASDIVERWRLANKWAVDFWDEVWDAFLTAVKNPDGRMCPAGRVNYQGFMVGGEIWVACYLPDNRPLMYRNVRERKVKVYDVFEPDTLVEVQHKLSFESEKGVKYLWKGILVENITQAACASILRAVLVHLDCPDLDFMPVVGHTHDEIVVLPDAVNAEAAGARLEEEMVKDRGWTEGLPMAADITIHDWYTKTLDD